MKVITIHQPWAGLIAIEAKRFETRGWRTNYRGTIAIHASKKEPHDVLQSLPKEVQRDMYRAYYDYFNITAGALKKMPTGVIVATANLVGCHCITGLVNGRDRFYYDHAQKRVDITGNELAFGDFTPGSYAWELADVQMLLEPIPAKGQQGLWNFEQ